MKRSYYIKFKYANWAHLFEYYLDADLLYRTKEKVKDFNYDYQVKRSGNLVFIEITDNLDKLIWWPEFCIEQATLSECVKKLTLALNAEVTELNLRELAYEMVSIDENLTPCRIGDKILSADNNSLESPYLKLKFKDTAPQDGFIYADIFAPEIEDEIMAAVLFDHYLTAIKRAIQINNPTILVSQNMDSLIVRSENKLNLSKIIDEAIEYLHKEAFDETCDKNREFLIKNINTAQIFEHSGYAVSRDKAAEIIKYADITKALRAIEFGFDD